MSEPGDPRYAADPIFDPSASEHGSCSVAFGRRFNHWRRSHGVSVADLADMVGLSTTTIYSWEEGKSAPTKEAWEMVREHFDDVPEPTADEFASSRLGRRVRREVTPPPVASRRVDPPQSLESLRSALETEFAGKRVTPHHVADFVVVFAVGESASTDLRQLEVELDVSAAWCVHDGKLALLVDRRVKGELTDIVRRHLGALLDGDVRVVTTGARIDACLGELNPETGTTRGVFVNAAELVTTLQEIWQSHQDRRVLVHVTQIRIAPL